MQPVLAKDEKQNIENRKDGRNVCGVSKNVV